MLNNPNFISWKSINYFFSYKMFKLSSEWANFGRPKAFFRQIIYCFRIAAAHSVLELRQKKFFRFSRIAQKSNVELKI